MAVVQGQNYAKTLISTLSSFAELLAVPQFSSALEIAKPLADGVQGLLRDSEVRLGLHQTLSAGDSGGYLVVLRAEEGFREGQVDSAKLLVKDNALRYGNSLAADSDVPYKGIDYVLFRIEVIEELPRAAWLNMPAIAEPMSEMFNAFKSKDTNKLESYFRAAYVAVWEAKELTDGQRNQALGVIEERYNMLAKPSGTKGLVSTSAKFDMAEAIQRGPRAVQALRAKPKFPAFATGDVKPSRKSAE